MKSREDSLKARLCQAIEEGGERLKEMAQFIYQNPETSFKEYEACNILTTFLKNHSFQVERGIGGLETAFRASYTKEEEGPTLAFLCEYDALPGLGHGCGHHLIGVGSAGAAAALIEVWPDLPGRVEVLGTPAEEGGGGKITMVEKGIFDSIDVAMMFHPTTKEHMVLRGGTALLPVTLKYRGQEAHAAADPHKGINALDAILQVFHSINALREHLRDDVRIHGYIKEGGRAANVVPGYAEAEFYLRAKSSKYLLKELKPRFKRIAEAAALATGASLTYSEDLLFAERRYSHTIAQIFTENLEELGEMTVAPDPEGGFGSSDIGNVSLVVPTIHPYISITREDMPHHSPQFMEAGIEPEAFKGLLLGTKALAMTGLDLLLQPELIEKAWQEHEKSSKE